MAGRRGDDQLRAYSDLPPRPGAPPGEALPDWQIIAQFARELGLEEAFPFERAEEVFEEFKQLTKGRPMDITGVTYARLKGPIQWPCPALDHPGTPRLYTDRRFHTPDGRARFIRWNMPTRSSVPAEFPLIDDEPGQNQWHTMTRTGKGKPPEELPRAVCGAACRMPDAMGAGRRFCGVDLPAGKPWPGQGPRRLPRASASCRSIGAGAWAFISVPTTSRSTRATPSPRPELKAAAVRVKKIEDGP